MTKIEELVEEIKRLESLNFNDGYEWLASLARDALPELRAVVAAERRLREKRAAVDEAIEGWGGVE